MGARRLAASFLLGGLAIVAASCGDTESPRLDTGPSEPGAPAPTSGRGANVSAPLDLAGVMRRVHFAYRPDGAGFTGGHTSYEVRASAGAFSVTPARTDLPREPGKKDLPPEALGAPATFETVSLGRGDAFHPAAVGEAHVEEDGHLVLPRGDAEEQLENTEDGVEQRWAFARRPEGQGDLVIRVRVAGEGYAGQTEGGQHFVDPTTGIGLRYGTATWIDGRGARTAVRVDYRVEAGELELAVPAAVLEASAYPAVLDPVVSPEYGIDNPIQGYVNGDQVNPDVVFNGTNYMVVWYDERTSARAIYGALVSPTGTLVTPGGILIASNGINILPDSKAAVGFDGTNHLVAWTEYNTTYSKYTLYGIRVSTAGAIVGSKSLFTSGTGVNPAIAFDGTNYLVVYDEGYSNSYTDLYAARVNKAGFNLNTITISTQNYAQRDADVVFDGTNYFVTWEDTRNSSSDIYGARVTPAGTVLDPSGIPISTSAPAQKTPAVAFDGNNYFAVWDDSKWGTSDIYGARISQAGLVLDPGGLEIAKAPGQQTAPGVAFDGSRYIVAWGDGRGSNADVYAARVLPDGTVLDPSGIQVTSSPGDQGNLVVSCAPASCLMAFEDKRSATLDIWGARIDGTGTVLDPNGFAISSSANEEKVPAVAWGNGQYLAVWQDHRAGSSWDIYGSRISQYGSALDPSGIAISTANGDQQRPDVSWNGSGWLVVWDDQRNGTTGDIYGARVQPDGTLLDPSGFGISTTAADQRVPAVDFDGTNHLVVWSDSRSGSGDIYGARVTTAGGVLDAAGILLGQQASADTNPDVAFDGTNHLVVWQHGLPSIFGSRVTPAGTLLNGTAGFQVLYWAQDAAVVYDGLNFFVVMEKSSDIRAVRVTSAGTVLDSNGFVITANAAYAEVQPTVTRDGQGTFVAWRDERNAGVGSIYGTWVSQAGDLSHPGGGLQISSITGSEHSYPAAAADGAGRVLVAYQRRATSGESNGHERAYIRMISALPTGDHCSSAGECASGFCVDGVCCNTACGGGSPTDCLACSVAAGAAKDGSCAPLNGSSCDDGNGCTVTDACVNGTCVGGGAKDCKAADSCHLDGTCNPATGACDNAAKPNGTACDDGSACTKTDACQAGVCVGTNAVVCPADTACTNVAACDPATGACAVTNEPDGTACDDGNACTQSSVCQAGQCMGLDGIVCPPPDQCHLPGSCNPATGICSYVAKADGTACDDGNACTQKDACQAGACVGSSPVVCPASTACQTVAACDPATGMCPVTNQPDGKACDDGNACTQKDACQAGECVGADPIICAPPGPCHQAVACDKGTGQCVYSDKPNGTPCDDGNACTTLDACKAGACVGAAPPSCKPLDECHEAGMCDPGTGECSNPPKADGAPCTGGTCVGGACQASPAGSGGAGGSMQSGTGGSAEGSGGNGGSGTEGQGTGGSTNPGTSGCGCRTAPQESNAPSIALLAAGLLLRRRRSRIRRRA